MKYRRQNIGTHVYIVDEIGSTNTELLEHAVRYEHGTVFCSRKQTAGRGRYKRDWRSQNGGLYFSILFKDQPDITNSFQLILTLALSIVRCIQSCASQGLAIKWPNDIYINHRKVCGILAESSTRGNSSNIVIGAGINVNNQVAHLSDLRHPAVSLKECRGEDIDLNILLDKIIDEFDLLYDTCIKGDFADLLPELNRLLYSKGQEVEISSGESRRNITPLAFTKDAELICLENGIEKTIIFGEM